MGKGFIYVLLALVAVALLTAIVYGIGLLIQRWTNRHDTTVLARLKEDALWEPDLAVGTNGEITISVLRAITVNEVREVFNGPIRMYQLPADHDPVDVQLKLSEARDRAALYNSLRDDKRLQP